MNANITPAQALLNAALSSQECSASGAAPLRGRPRERLSVWEIAAMFHCSVLGTCLSLSELSAIARRARHGLPQGASPYDVHVHFVKAVATKNSLSKLVDKALEKRHASAARALRRARSERELDDLWKELVARGDVAGSYWAAMSHPLASEPLQWRWFGEVHMLSHLLGASRSSDLSRLHKLEHNCAQFESELGLVKHQHRAVRKQKDKLALDLSEQQLETDRLERRLLLAQDRIALLRAQGGVEALEARLAELEGELHSARIRGSEADARLRDNAAVLAEARAAESAARERLTELLEENEAMEAELRANLEAALAKSSASANEAEAQRRLDGRRILYVGGRSHLVPYYRVLAERRGVEFLHHDGGLEESLDAVTRGLATIDAVVCPVDCVSHAACTKVKQACKRLSKQFIALRSPGLSSFARGLTSVL